MKFLRVCALGAAVALMAACSKDVDGVAVTPDPVAGLRYINVVADSSGLDFRVIDVVSNAPNTVNATFRTGGSPYGVSAGGFLPPHFAVMAGTRHIRVFPNSTDATIASQVVLDTTYTFTEGQNYTVYLYGYLRAGGTPHATALITNDVPTTPAAGNIAVRVLNLIPTAAGAPSPTTAVDAWVVPQATVAPFTGAPTFGAVAFTGLSNYVNVPIAASYMVAVTAAGTATPQLFSVNMTAGTAGTATADPVPGSNIALSGFTAILVPHGVAGSPSASFATPSIILATDLKPPRTAP